MLTIAHLSQLIIAISIVIVWVFRFDNIVKEFKQYELSDQMRSIVGALKISLATLLVAGIWYDKLVLVPALTMAVLMICAQAAHFKVKNPWSKRLPSLALFILCIFVAYVNYVHLPA
jgi:hypothetical protein